MRLLSSRSDPPPRAATPAFGAVTRRTAGLVTVTLAVVLAGVAIQRGTDSLPPPIALPGGAADEAAGPTHVVEPAGPVHLAGSSSPTAPAPQPSTATSTR